MELTGFLGQATAPVEAILGEPSIQSNHRSAGPNGGPSRPQRRLEAEILEWVPDSIKIDHDEEGGVAEIYARKGWSTPENLGDAAEWERLREERLTPRWKYFAGSNHLTLSLE